jgi:pimeloyl-ACP methyl ester carboxylesterase
VDVALLVLLNAMVPRPGESAGEWWAATGLAQARAAQAQRDGHDVDDLTEAFLHDLPPNVRAQVEAARNRTSRTPDAAQWPLDRWPDVATRCLHGRDDRFLPVEFQRRVVAERLGIPVDEMDGGHLVALSRPVELADRLEAYRLEQATPEQAAEMSDGC